MEEAGVPIADFSSDAMADFNASDFDVVISCCGCGSRLDGTNFDPAAYGFDFDDWNLDDPPATDPGDLSEYRRVRDEIKVKVEELLTAIKTKA